MVKDFKLVYIGINNDNLAKSSKYCVSKSYSVEFNFADERE